MSKINNGLGLGVENHWVVFCGTGSTGDAKPLSQLCLEIVSRGFLCKVLSNVNHQHFFEHPNIEFFSVCKSMQNNLIAGEKLLEEYYKPTLSNTFSHLEKLYRLNKNLSIVSLSQNRGAANIFAEKYDLPLVSIYLSAGFISPEEKLLLSKKSVKINIKNIFSLVVSRFDPLVRGINKELKSLRIRSGVNKISSIDSYRSIGCRVGLFPKWFPSQELDIFREIKCCGFPLSKDGKDDSDIKKDYQLWSFLNKNDGEIIIFTPGTATTDVRGFFSTAIDVCRKLDMAGLFLSPYVDGNIVNVEDNVLLRSYVELSTALPFAKLIVHHGGIGTVSAAIQSGVSQIIRPLKYDQPYNANRVLKLGLGVVITPSMFNEEVVCKFAKLVMKNSVVQRQVKLAQKEVLKEDAIKLAGEVINDYILLNRPMKLN